MQHGLISSYRKGCRCRPCKDQNNKVSRIAKEKQYYRRKQAGQCTRCGEPSKLTLCEKHLARARKNSTKSRKAKPKQ